MLNVIIRNKEALAELSKGNEVAAQILLRRNIKKNPCCLTFNNLGIYYCQYGMILENGKIRNAERIGMKYLIKASSYEKNWNNCVSAATAACELDNYNLAYEFFENAYTIKADDLVLYNIGCCLYRLRKYEDAIIFFKSIKMYDNYELIDWRGGQNPLLIIAYCYKELSNMQGCFESLYKYRQLWKTEERFDVFCLKYFCGLYEDALEEWESLLKEWYPTNSILAMLVECSMRIENLEIVKDNMIPKECQRVWKRLKEDKNYRLKEIEKYFYLPPLICMYHFID